MNVSDNYAAKYIHVYTALAITFNEWNYVQRIIPSVHVIALKYDNLIEDKSFSEHYINNYRELHFIHSFLKCLLSFNYPILYSHKYSDKCKYAE